MAYTAELIILFIVLFLIYWGYAYDSGNNPNRRNIIQREKGRRSYRRWVNHNAVSRPNGCQASLAVKQYLGWKRMTVLRYKKMLKGYGVVSADEVKLIDEFHKIVTNPDGRVLIRAKFLEAYRRTPEVIQLRELYDSSGNEWQYLKDTHKPIKEMIQHLDNSGKNV